jgi:hypothetical protein
LSHVRESVGSLPSFQRKHTEVVKRKSRSRVVRAEDLLLDLQAASEKPLSLRELALDKVIAASGPNIDALNPGFAGMLGQVRIDYLDAARNALARNQKGGR